MKKRFIIGITIAVFIIGAIIGVLVVKPTFLPHFIEQKKELKPYFLIADKKQQSIVQSENLFGGINNELTKYLKVYYFGNKHLLARNLNGQLFYAKYNAEGQFTRMVDNNVKSSIDATAEIQILENNDNIYLIYLFPYSAIRLITIDKDNNVTTNLFEDTAFNQYYEGNEVFNIGDKIYIPNGTDTKKNETALYEIDGLTKIINKKVIDTSPCGNGNWELYTNVGKYLTLKSTNSVCFYDVENKIVTYKLSAPKNAWYRYIPSIDMVMEEEYRIASDIPTSIGVINFYEVNTGKKYTVSIADKELFLKAQNASAGGLWFSNKFAVDGSKQELVLYSIGSEINIATSINIKDMSVKKIQEIGTAEYWNAIPIMK